MFIVVQCIVVVSVLIECICDFYCFFFFFKQKTAYEMRISDWSSDVCSSDLEPSSSRIGAGTDLRPCTGNCRGRRDRPSVAPASRQGRGNRRHGDRKSVV